MKYIQYISEKLPLSDAKIRANPALLQILKQALKSHDYFTDRGVNNEHGGGGYFAFDKQIMGWLFKH